MYVVVIIVVIIVVPVVILVRLRISSNSRHGDHTIGGALARKTRSHMYIYIFFFGGGIIVLFIENANMPVLAF